MREEKIVVIGIEEVRLGSVGVGGSMIMGKYQRLTLW